MSLYKDLNNNIHDDEDGAALSYPSWPKTGLTKITLAEADFINMPTQTQLDKLASDKAKADLLAIDIASVRAIREYIVSKTDAPQLLKDKDSLASTVRVKVKP